MGEGIGCCIVQGNHILDVCDFRHVEKTYCLALEYRKRCLGEGRMYKRCSTSGCDSVDVGKVYLLGVTIKGALLGIGKELYRCYGEELLDA